MTLYLDTSSLVKLYVEEPGSDEVRQDLGEADIGRDIRGVLRRGPRGIRAPPARRQAHARRCSVAVKRDFDADWSRLAIVEPTVALCRAAGELAERYGLRGCDSIQLATFLEVAREDAAIRDAVFELRSRA